MKNKKNIVRILIAFTLLALISVACQRDKEEGERKIRERYMGLIQKYEDEGAFSETDLEISIESIDFLESKVLDRESEEDIYEDGYNIFVANIEITNLGRSFENKEIAIKNSFNEEEKLLENGLFSLRNQEIKKEEIELKIPNSFQFGEISFEIVDPSGLDLNIENNADSENFISNLNYFDDFELVRNEDGYTIKIDEDILKNNEVSIYSRPFLEELNYKFAEKVINKQVYSLLERDNLTFYKEKSGWNLESLEEAEISENEEFFIEISKVDSNLSSYSKIISLKDFESTSRIDFIKFFIDDILKSKEEKGILLRSDIAVDDENYPYLLTLQNYGYDIFFEEEFDLEKPIKRAEVLWLLGSFADVTLNGQLEDYQEVQFYLDGEEYEIDEIFKLELRYLARDLMEQLGEEHFIDQIYLAEDASKSFINQLTELYAETR